MRLRLFQLSSGAAMVAILSLTMVSVRGQGQGQNQQRRQPNPTQDETAFEHGLVTKGADVVPGTRKDPPPPKLPWGDPDLQGTWAGMTTTPMEKPAEGRVVITDPALLDAQYDTAPAETGGGVGTYNAAWHETGLPVPGRDYLVTDPPDGRLPPLTPEGEKMRAAQPRRNAGEGGADLEGSQNPEDRSLHERCLNWETMIDGGGNNRWYRIVQTPGWVAINAYRIHDMRLIPLDGRPHLPQDVRPWMGDSRGHWEGNTLVVETTNYNGKNDGQPNLKSKNMRLVERFTRVDIDTINYQATVEDPAVRTKPWTIMNPLVLDEAGFYEYACHEGNYSMTGILAGARAKEKAAK